MSGGVERCEMNFEVFVKRPFQAKGIANNNPEEISRLVNNYAKAMGLGQSEQRGT